MEPERPDIDTLINGYLDDTLSEAEVARLNAWLLDDPENPRRFARETLRHNRLRDLASSMNPAPGLVRSRARVTPFVRRRRVVFAAVAAVGLFFVLAFFQSGGSRRLAAAEAQLDRLIQAAAGSGDRTYRIKVLEGAESQDRGGGVPKGRPQPSIDGALLHVRGDGQYILIRQPDTADVFVTGSDGQVAWSVPPDGAVRISPDPRRFRGAMPGEQQGLPFLELGSALSKLKESYELSLEPGSKPQLVARKRSSAFRGPRDVRITFDASSGLILQLQMDGLPRAQGGPRSVVLNLLNQSDLGPDFYRHDRFHGSDRELIHEPR